VTFTGVAGATDYQARWRAAGSSDPWTLTQSAATSPVTANGMTNGTLYELQLRSHNAAGFGDWTPLVTATPLGPPVGITVASGLETQVPVSWTAEPGATDYELQWRARGAPSWTSAGWTTGTSVTVSGLTNDTTYEFQVRARDGNGVTVWSYSYQGTPRRWAQISAGYDHTCAVTVSHRAYCWGGDDHGQLGDGSYGIDRLRPVPVDTTTGLTATNVASIDAGTSFTCAVTTAGKAYCWGLNGNGQLGDGTTVERDVPTPVDTGTGLTDTTVASVNAGQYHACAVTTGHDAYCWGANGTSQLGDGTTTEQHLPTHVDTSTGLSGNVASVSAGSFHSCAVTTDSRAFCWGANGYGQIGDGTTTTRAVPTPVAANGYFYPQTGAPYGNNVSGISAGQYHTCAVTTWSAAYCWGNNSYGQLGDTTTTDRSVPTAVDISNGVIGSPSAVSAGAWSTCAASQYSGISCWGANAQGQLGDGTTTERDAPAAIDTSTGFVSYAAGSVSVGTWQACGVSRVYAGGTADCWGLDTHGQLGDGSTTQNSSPTALDHTPIPALPDDATGLTTTSGQELQVPLTWSAVTGAEDYQVRWRTYGGGTWTTLPSTVATTATVTGLVDRVGYEFQVRAHDAAGFSAWTSSATGSPGAPDVPVGVTADSGLDGQARVSWTWIIGADEHQVQWRTNGSGSWTTTAWTTGNSIDVSGLTNHTTYEFQVRARNSGGTTGWSGSVTAIPRQWAQVSFGSAHACAVTVSGRAYCWGHNDAGQIGDGTSGVDRLSPVPVDTTTGLTTTNVASISAGNDIWDGTSGHTCAVTKAGALYCWGLNNSGQLGDGTATNQLTPTPVLTSSGLTSVKQVVGANEWTCAVSTAGQAFCWGHQWWGELGNGWSASGSTPIPVTTGTGLTTSNVASISAYGMQTCAVTTGGQAYCWGGNSNGSLGNGTLSTSSSVPAPVDTTTGLTATNVAQISVGWMFACASTTAGQAYCWGDNESAQLGDGSWWDPPANSPTRPVAVTTGTGLTTSNVVAIGAADWHTCALTNGGSVYCWGVGGDLGDGAGSGYNVPHLVDGSAGLTAGAATQLSVGGAGGCALTGAATGGTAYCWGPGGLIGDGTGSQRNTPTPVSGATTPDAPSSAPANLAATSGQSTQAPLAWDALAGAAEYQVRWRVQGDPSWTTTGWTAATSTTVTGLTGGTTYEFQVRAHNGGGFGPWSSSVLGTP
jgi:alpha-tubulin suppressor-like RCC1 family protein